MKKVISLLLALAVFCGLLPQISLKAEAANYQVAMTAYEFVEYLKVALSRKNVYSNKAPQNLGYYNGDTISWDCWNLGKTIIWSKGDIVYNETVGHFQYVDGESGLGDWTGEYIVRQSPNCSSDFSELVPGEWLHMTSLDHTGYYIGNGEVIECTMGWGLNGITISQIGSDGTRSRNGIVEGKWSIHGKVPWLDYEASPLVKKSYPAYCMTEVTADTTLIKSHPCSAEYDACSTDVEQAAGGTSYLATKLIQNVLGELWYEVTAKNQQTGYLYAGDAAYLAQKTDDLMITGAKAPDFHRKGNLYYLYGTISSSYNQLTEVSAYVYDAAGNSRTGHSVTVSGNSYTLKDSAIDGKTAFGSLTAGMHTYVVAASYKNYYATSATTVAENTGKVTLFDATFNVVTTTTSCIHDYKLAVITEETCVSNGKKVYTCSKCNTGYSEIIPATQNHRYTESVTAATCTASGVKVFTCENCFTKYQENIPATGHSHTASVTAPTCTEEGFTTYTCTCGDTYTADQVAAIGHSYEKGICIYCGEEQDEGILTGKLTTYGEGEAVLLLTSVDEAAPIVYLNAPDGEYRISAIPGDYILQVSKTGNATRSYSITIVPGETLLNVELNRRGDLNADGRLTVGDVAKVYAYIRKALQLNDDYQLLCADYNEDGHINVGDTAQIYAYIKFS